jgi:hypothetical protein
MSDAIVINDHMVNESRFQFERQNENHYPDSSAPTISVQGDFSGGGYGGQQSRDHYTRLEFQNMTTMSHGAHAIKFGTRLRDSEDASYTNGGFNGSFNFASPVTYMNLANNLLTPGQTYSTLVTATNNAGPSNAGYTICANGVANCKSSNANVFDMAWYAQDDWKFNPRLTLSGGLRWEAQNHIADHDDWAPRAALAYALDGNGKDKKAKTVLRAGYGFFYDRMGTGNLKNVHYADIQNQIVFVNPTCNSSETSLDYDLLAKGQCQSNGSLSSASSPVQYQIDPKYHSPYSEQGSISLERQVNASISATLTYMHTFGVHQTTTINANQATDGNPLDNKGGFLNEYFPEAVFKQNQIIASLRGNLTKKFNLTGFYTLSYANGNNNGSAVNAYNLDENYGRSGFVTRNNLFMMGNYTAPWGIRLNPFLVAQSGRPFNITLPTDPLNNFFNQRPAYAGATTQPDSLIQTSLGSFDIDPCNATYPCDYTPIPINLGNGPAAVAVNLRVSKAIGLGRKLVSATAQPEGGPPNGPPPGGPPPGGGGRGGPGGGGPGGGFGGPMGLGGGSNNTGRRYSLTFSAQALNLFNDIDKGQPNGTIIPTKDPTTGIIGPGSQFGKSTNLAGQMFSQGSAARRIFVQAVFSF